MGLEEPYGFNTQRLKHLNPRKMKWNQNCVCASQISTSFFGSWPFDHPNGSHQQPLKRSSTQTPKGSLGRTWTSSFLLRWTYMMRTWHAKILRAKMELRIGNVPPKSPTCQFLLDASNMLGFQTPKVRRYDWTPQKIYQSSIKPQQVSSWKTTGSL